MASRAELNGQDTCDDEGDTYQHLSGQRLVEDHPDRTAVLATPVALQIP